MGSGVVSGIGAGASAGASFGPWGAAIGAVVGGLGGLLGDKKAAKARKFTKKANKLRTDATVLRSFSEQRLLLRQAQLAQAQGLAANAASGVELDSSGNQGFKASIQNQRYDNYLLGESILNEQLDANYYDAKAGNAMTAANDIMGYVNLAANLVSLVPHTNKPPPTTYGPDSPNGLYSPTLSNSFDTSLVMPNGLQTQTGLING